MVCYILQWSRFGNWFSYFNESDLKLTAGDLGHLNEEGRLVCVVFNDVIVHVDEDPERETSKNKKVNSVMAKSKCISLFDLKKHLHLRN